MDRILVFIPMYNCAPQIGRVLAQFAESAVRDRFAQILVLDNGSKDGGMDAAIAAAKELDLPNVTIARNRDNYGLGGSHKSAFGHAAREGFTHVVVLHGDDQGSIADLLPILDEGLHRRFDACLGSRFMRASRLQGYSKFRIFGNYVFNGLFTAGARRVVSDLGSGLNIFNRKIVTDTDVSKISDDLRFNVYLLLSAFDKGWTTFYFPIGWSETDQVSNVKMASQATRTLKILAQYIANRGSFRSADHRDRSWPSYTFDEVWRSGQPAPNDGRTS